MTSLVPLLALWLSWALTLATPPAWAARPPAPAHPLAAPITLEVDATNTAQWIYEVRETVPASPGSLRLLYPRWLPGFHGPHGDTGQIGGLTIQAGGKRLAWRRPADNLSAFDVEVPDGVTQVEVRFQWLGNPKGGEYPPPMSKDLLGVQWHGVLMYPAGHEAAAIQVRPALRLPAGWQWGSALRAREERDGWIRFQPVSLEALVDSPVYAGAAYRRIDLDEPGAAQPVVLHLFTDPAETKAPTDQQIDAHRRLVQQADRLFGWRPWRHYDLLLANIKGISFTALEHQESSENAYDGRYFEDWATASRRRDDVAHEFVHAWNGKYRRPADLWAPDFNTVSSNALLWVYEGLTQYWGIVMATRSGLITPEQAQLRFANGAAWYQELPGRQWRNLQDTTNDPAARSSGQDRWPAWSRGWDYYGESALLIWLDADTLIRESTDGQRSLDDFARLFFRGTAGDKGPDLYTFDDVVAALNQVHRHDWRTFMRERLDRTASQVPLDGLRRAGWRLDFKDQRSALQLSSLDPKDPTLRLLNSIGLAIGKDGEIKEVQWGSLAFGAGLAPGDKLVAVHLKAYDAVHLEAALVANKSGGKPIDLLVRRDDDFRHIAFDYRGGPRHAALVRVDGAPDRLADILRAR
ncbi:peptidase M61 [Ideonella sp. A 288]|uniref:M61 family metallopeptidase n=1 Tax=Ideonella sp. A 288 TaxID=1962181 RepID=UPI001303432F|nr:peptidase M61 [Ideonella sp. A 288]